MWQPYFPAFDGERPYIVAYIQLDEGPCLMSTLVDCNPDEIACDMPVEVVFDDVTNEVTLPKFRLVAGVR